MRLPRSPPPRKSQRDIQASQSESSPNLTGVLTELAAPITASQTPPSHANPSGVVAGVDDDVTRVDGTDREIVEILSDKEGQGKKDDAIKVAPESCGGMDGIPPSQATDNGASDPNMIHKIITDAVPEVRRLDSDAYKPWGSRSNNASPIPGAGPAHSGPDADPPPKDSDNPDLSVCIGGPGKTVCNSEVKHGDGGGVECEKCQRWFHSKCQGLTKWAITALNKWHGTLLWVCDQCKISLKVKDKPQPETRSAQVPDLTWLDTKINKLETIIRHTENTLSDSIRNQEKMFTVQCKVLDKLEASSVETVKQQVTYAEALKGIGTEVVKQVSQKIDKMPQVTVPVQRNREEIAGVLDEIQDKEKRKLNIIIHNLPESTGDTHAVKRKGDEEKFTGMIKEGLKLVVKCANAFRIGKSVENRPRLLLITLTNVDDKMNILRSAAALRSTTEWDNVYITPDLTWQEREKARTLRQELARRKAAGEKFLQIRHGRIVPVPEDKRHPPSKTAMTHTPAQSSGLQPGTQNHNGGTNEAQSRSPAHHPQATPRTGQDCTTDVQSSAQHPQAAPAPGTRSSLGTPAPRPSEAEQPAQPTASNQN